MPNQKGLFGTVLAAALLAAGAAHALDKVTFGTGWLPQAEFGGFYQAKLDGTYEKYGLDVTIQPGGPQVNTSQMIAAGALDFARIPTSTSMFNMVAQDLPYVAVAAFYQEDPQVIITHADQGVKTMADLKGRPIMMTQESTTTWFPYLVGKFGLETSQIRPYAYGSAPFLADHKVATQGYLTNDVLSIRRKGYDVTPLLLADNGYTPYATIVATSKKLADTNPDLVQRFVDASIMGWKTYLAGDRKAVNEAIVKGNPDYPPEHAEAAVKVIKDNGFVDGGDAKTMGIGAMTDARWKEFFDTLVAVKAFPATLDYKKAYTLKFVNKKVGVQ